MQGKTIVVTGGTSGIGEVAAVELARRGGKVVIVGRSKTRSDATLEKIRAAGGVDASAVVADLSVQSEVRRAAGEIRNRCERLDVLLNNAGAIFDKRVESSDGIEMTFALNHLAYFLMTQELLPLLEKSAPARVVSVASDAHRFAAAGINFDDVEGRKKYSAMGAYGQSKLANILFTLELSKRLAGTGVTANAVHPGFVATRFIEGKGTVNWIFRQLAVVMATTPEAGAKTSIYVASSPEIEGVTGKYFVKCRETTPNKAARDEAAAKRLWELSEAMTRQPATPS
jgi:NAD(P)-dependent dehydrogenase (short-subunit alcohol dehydrogenase family)